MLLQEQSQRKIADILKSDSSITTIEALKARIAEDVQKIKQSCKIINFTF